MSPDQRARELATRFLVGGVALLASTGALVLGRILRRVVEVLA